MAPQDRIERAGVVLERWQWEAIAGVPSSRLRGLARKYLVETFVYFIADGDAVKIGQAREPEKRLDELQTGNPRKLELKQVICGDFKIEQRLHALWTHKGALIRDEWFSGVDQILELAGRLLDKQLEVFERDRFVHRELVRCVEDTLREEAWNAR